MLVHLLSMVLLFSTLHLISSNLIRGFNDDLCDPHTVTSEHYPSLLVRLDVQKTSPLKLKATYRLPNSTREFSFEGMVLTGGFPVPAELAACRSLGCSESAGATPMGWTAQSTCEFTCPDGTSAMQKCRFMIKQFQCPTDAMNLLECLTNERFWEYATNVPGSSYKGLDLKCIKCED
ncbi:unnamed protein product [Didymodactylos carnosus]|uniref:Uncharacterized protein n=1 Tax=Didymodactylos carnosus TaxID=1234261 RepID=A0A815Q3M9_9BILA|nr:unnamed protein product [Didymodactylos carnosus]CAF1458346.1 unnamed protein product [Didymodactylos carnosus]CAF4099357.1 unnamed protein product [Didymodactylos carnosus]CAF4329409.1 unnamed protein product [Didymodactylos carnosus]